MYTFFCGNHYKVLLLPSMISYSIFSLYYSLCHSILSPTDNKWCVVYLQIWYKVWSLVTHSCPTFCDPHKLYPIRLLCPWNSPARVLEWVAIPFSRGSSWSRDRTQVSCTAGRFFTVWATTEALHHLMGGSKNQENPNETPRTGRDPWSGLKIG